MSSEHEAKDHNKRKLTSMNDMKFEMPKEIEELVKKIDTLSPPAMSLPAP